MTCDLCGHALAPGDARERHTSATRSEPAMTIPACVFCTPDEDEEVERDWDWERDRREADGER
jgi:hypothetical protein